MRMVTLRRANPMLRRITLNCISAAESALSHSAALKQRFMAFPSRFFASRLPTFGGGLIQPQGQARAQNDIAVFVSTQLPTYNRRKNRCQASVGQIASLVLVRLMTSLVNSVVLECPPRSAVRTSS